MKPRPEPKPAWLSRQPIRHRVGELTVRANEPEHQVECEHCGALRVQQLVQGEQTSRVSGRKYIAQWWVVLPCVKCPLDLRARAS